MPEPAGSFNQGYLLGQGMHVASLRVSPGSSLVVKGQLDATGQSMSSLTKHFSFQGPKLAMLEMGTVSCIQ